MELNPYEARLRMLQQVDGVQQQREAAPDAETAGCPGCPYFWTCPVPHRGEEVRAPAEIELEDVREQLGPRGEYRPRDESDVGWTDVWIEEDLPEEQGAAAPGEEAADEDAEDPEPDPPVAGSEGPDGTPVEPAEPAAAPRSGGVGRLLRRLRRRA